MWFYLSRCCSQLTCLLTPLLIFPGLASQAEDLVFQRHVINETTDYSAAALMDVNHDGQIDIVCGGSWYEGPEWTKHFVADIPRIGGRPDGFSHLVFDVNRDGWMDIITVNYRSRSIKWMEHPGEGLGAWKVHTAVEPGPMETGRLVDIDGDGNLDLLPNGANFAAWWEFRWNSENAVGAPAWIRHDLPAEAGGHGLGFGDIDGDGRNDIVGQNGWLSAPEDVRSGNWTWHPEYKIERGSIPMLVVDPDKDGDNDIVWCSAHGFGVYWLEQSRDAENQRTWTRHAIDTSWSQGHSPLWVDLDGNGQNELVAGKRYMAHGGKDPGEYDPIVAYRYEFNKHTRTWDRWPLAHVGERVGMGLDPKVADIDGDGDLDLLASGRSGLYWLENLGAGDSARHSAPIPTYRDPDNLTFVIKTDGSEKQIQEPEAWGLRRYHATNAIERSLGSLPSSSERVPLQLSVSSAVNARQTAEYSVQRVSFQLNTDKRVDASLYIPTNLLRSGASGIVCMFDGESDALATQVASELASRGFVCIVPSQDALHAESKTREFVWLAMRSADVLQACDRVHGEQIGYIGDALNGQAGLYLAALDQRIVATITDASQASRLHLDGPADFSIAELIASVAPRALNLLLPTIETDELFMQQANLANFAFELRSVPDHLTLTHRPSAINRESPEQIYQQCCDWLVGKFPPPQFKLPAATGQQH